MAWMSQKVEEELTGLNPDSKRTSDAPKGRMPNRKRLLRFSLVP